MRINKVNKMLKQFLTIILTYKKIELVKPNLAVNKIAISYQQTPNQLSIVNK